MKMLLRLNRYDRSMIEFYSPDKDYLLCVMSTDALYLMINNKPREYNAEKIRLNLLKRLRSGEKIIVSLNIEG